MTIEGTSTNYGVSGRTAIVLMVSRLGFGLKLTEEEPGHTKETSDTITNEYAEADKKR